MALSRNNRIRNETDIRAILKKGKTVQGSFFFLKVQSAEESVGRAAVVVSSKVAKTAILRNRMKRVLSETIRHYFQEGGRIDLVCMVTRSFEVDDPKAQEELAGALQRISL